MLTARPDELCRLVANAIVAWNLIAAQQVLDQPQAEGPPIARELRRQFSPTLNAHINKIGKFDINPSRGCLISQSDRVLRLRRPSAHVGDSAWTSESTRAESGALYLSPMSSETDVRLAVTTLVAPFRSCPAEDRAVAVAVGLVQRGVGTADELVCGFIEFEPA